MRSYFKLATEQTGVLVTKVLPLFTSDGVLKRGDVLMAVDGESIADNGTVSVWKILIFASVIGNSEIIKREKVIPYFLGKHPT